MYIFKVYSLMFGRTYTLCNNESTIKLINKPITSYSYCLIFISLSLSLSLFYFFFFIIRTLELYFLSKIQVQVSLDILKELISRSLWIPKFRDAYVSYTKWRSIVDPSYYTVLHVQIQSIDAEPKDIKGQLYTINYC